MKQPKVSEKMIRCVRCDNPLWTMKVLSWTKDGKPMSTEWHSANLLIEENEPKSWTCPLSIKAGSRHLFAIKSGDEYRLKTVDLITKTSQMI